MSYYRTFSHIAILLFVGALCASCGQYEVRQAAEDRASKSPIPPASTPMPVVQPSIPPNGDYPSRGKVTKINNELGSVELDHEDIPGLMPPMIMEFFVSDKALLKGLKLGDQVNFTVRNKDGQETIVAISKAK